MNNLKYTQNRLEQRMEARVIKRPLWSTSHLVTLLLIISGLASAPLSLLKDRSNIGDVLLMYAVQNESSAAYTWLSRSLNGIIAILLIMLVIKVSAGRALMTVRVRNIFVASCVSFLFSFGLGSMFGTYPGLPNFLLLSGTVSLLILPFIKGLSTKRLLDVFIYVSRFMLVGSLLIGMVLPDISYMADPNYSFAAGGSGRLIGFFADPTTLGLYAVMLFAIELRLGVRGGLHIVSLFVCPIVLVLSVSKTAIILATIFLIWHLASRGKLRALTLMIVLVAGCGYLLMGNNLLSYFSANENIMTLTGRTELWKSILDAWVKNPLFGNGPDYFSGFGRTEFAHAHNLFLQAVSDGGLFGLIGLIGYIYALLSIALKNAASSRSLSILLVLLLMAFSMTDAVMRIDSFVSGWFFVNAFVILYLCSLDRQRRNQCIKIRFAKNHQVVVNG